VAYFMHSYGKSEEKITTKIFGDLSELRTTYRDFTKEVNTLYIRIF
jgi:hypothetical protein